ncbi:response regulator transcription factor [Caloramator sp. mosi_1]|uniref:response regulator transcription factor n=1 Tax=Caloramator sp. mosi_1 TaxID=3023090 RepID=UPI0023620252|nr:response regulator transcription factor [Caloramator sp. mosi_1]WDC85549.1 response regulator transcription factor [Caloramator sp. mosi_1]
MFDSLSKREVEVLLRISQGYSNKEIGEQLFLSEKTVKNYATNIFDKLNVKDRVQAAIVAIENNIEEYYKRDFSPYFL